jgi:hypothetical protein
MGSLTMPSKRPAKEIPRFALRFPAKSIRRLAEKYLADLTPGDREAERQVVAEIGPAVRARGYYTPEEFVTVCHWKSRRPQKRYEAIPADRIVEATRLALAARDEALRIGIPVALDGVGWPTASVLLHLGHPDPYPILDFRALESLGAEPPSQYTFPFWWAYVGALREIAARNGVDMRTLDRALWQWSAERD